MGLGRVVIIHANEKAANPIACVLDRAGYAAKWYPNLRAGFNENEKERFELVIADERAPCENGQSIYEHCKTTALPVPLILLSDSPSLQRAVEAIKMGASDYLTAPVEKELLLAAVAKVRSLQKKQPKKMNVSPGAQRHLIAHSESMLDLLSVSQRIAASSATVLIQGESGTGKELLARYIHQSSDRRDQPFVAMNCAALPDNLAESELFGYDKGAFTGATKTRPGKFELAHKGTLLLDEISEMPLTMQAKLLRVLQEKEVDHLGGSKPIKVDVRCIATSNQDLPQMVKAGSFRRDLYFRLRVIPLDIPPLRKRKEDIPHLLAHFINKFHTDNETDRPRFDDASVEYMKQWHWPGNVRELENTVERALLISSGPDIGKASLYLDQEISEANSAQPEHLVGMTVKELERKLIGQTLSHLNQNRTHAAKMLGISIRTLRNKLREYHDNEEDLIHEMQGKDGPVR